MSSAGPASPGTAAVSGDAVASTGGGAATGVTVPAGSATAEETRLAVIRAEATLTRYTAVALAAQPGSAATIWLK